MKKLFAYTAIAYLSLASVAFFTTSCGSKDEDPAPTTTVPGITSVTSRSVTLGNQFSATKEGYVVSTDSKAAITAAFDVAYGNGSAAGNKFFLGGSSDESIKAVYSLTAAGTNTNFISFGSASNVTAARFDTLVNKAAVSVIYDLGTATAAASNGTSTRIKSETAWAVGEVFGFTTPAGTKVIAKITTAPTGSTPSTAGTVGFQIKF